MPESKNFMQVQMFPLHTLEQTMTAVKALGTPSAASGRAAAFSQCSQEGYVVVDGTYNRVKARSHQSLIPVANACYRCGIGGARVLINEFYYFPPGVY